METKGNKSKKLSGFESLLVEITNKAKKTKFFLEAFKLVLTLDNRIPIKMALNSLTIKQRELYILLENNENGYILRPEFDDKSRFIAFGIKKIGRIIIQDPSKRFDPGDTIIGYIRVPEDIYINWTTLYLQSQKIEESFNQEAYSFISNQPQEKTNEMLDFIYKNIYHIDPIIIYVNEQILSTFYFASNLYKDRRNSHLNLTNIEGSTYLLEKLYSLSVSEWSHEEMVFVYCAYWLLKTNNPSRIEEFNGCQLSVKRVHIFLNKKINLYSQKLNLKADQQYKSTIPDKIETLQSLDIKILSNFQKYRIMNGINLNKKELLMPKISHDKSNFPIQLNGFFKDNYGMDIENYDNSYDFFYDWLSTQFLLNESDKELTPVEEVLRHFCLEAVEQLNADIAMTRGVRNFKSLIELTNNESYNEICKWSPSDYYCCVTPSKRLQEELKGKESIISNISKAVSRRMQYNCWHFIPGNLPIEQVPANRHFFFPPQFPDIAEWSDQHHLGHVNSSVRFSIRSPESLRIGNFNYNGMIDLRVMRKSGSTFTISDLIYLTELTRHLKDFWQAIIDFIIERNLEIKVRSFDKKYYENSSKGE